MALRTMLNRLLVAQDATRPPWRRLSDVVWQPETQRGGRDDRLGPVEAFKALRIAETWIFTVGSARSSVRHMALLLLPCAIKARTSSCLVGQAQSAIGVTGLSRRLAPPLR